MTIEQLNSLVFTKDYTPTLTMKVNLYINLMNKLIVRTQLIPDTSACAITIHKVLFKDISYYLQIYTNILTSFNQCPNLYYYLFVLMTLYKNLNKLMVLI